jgi:mandelate racemase
MTVPRLTLRSIGLRSVSIPLKRPVVSKVGLFDRWPLVLIDLHTEEGIVGRSYLEPYLERSVRYLVLAIRDLAESAQVRTGSTTRRFSDRGRAKLDRARVIALAE